MDKCLYDENRECWILTKKNCKGCKFRKSATEFTLAQYEADQMLSRKGLTRVKKFHNGQFIITTKKKDRNDEDP